MKEVDLMFTDNDTLLEIRGTGEVRGGKYMQQTKCRVVFDENEKRREVK